MPDEEQRYVTRGELNCDQMIRMLADVSNVLTKKKTRWLTVFFGACLLVLLLEGLLLASWKPVIVAVLLGLVRFLCFMLTKYVLKKQKQSFMEQYPEGVLAYENGFAEDGVHVHNLTNGAKARMAYDSLKKLVSCGDEWALVSKAGVCIPLFPAQLSETDRESVLAMLQEKNQKIKIKLK